MKARITIEFLDEVPGVNGNPVVPPPVHLELSDLHIQQDRKVYAKEDWGFSGGQPVLVPDPVTSVTLSGKTVPDSDKLAEFQRQKPYLRELSR